MRCIWVVLLAQLLESATGQNPWDVPTGPIVLYRYSDANCTKRVMSGWSQQSWAPIDGADRCYDLTQGPLCDVAPCVVKLSCAYESGSGLVHQRMATRECNGAPVTAAQPVAPTLLWLQAVDLFEHGGCFNLGGPPDIPGTGRTPVASMSYVKFGVVPLHTFPRGYPDCSTQGDVASTYGGGSSANFVDEYNLQYYSDDHCQEPYTITASSIQMTSAFKWQVHRGAEHCFDMVDSTPPAVTDNTAANAAAAVCAGSTAENLAAATFSAASFAGAPAAATAAHNAATTAATAATAAAELAVRAANYTNLAEYLRVNGVPRADCATAITTTTPRPAATRYNKLNMRLTCGNPDGVGNGVLVNTGYREPKCRGTNTLVETWRDAFYPMNQPVIKELFGGKCIRWGQFSVKFDKPWNESHYPDCSDYACKTGLCAGGRIMSAGAVTGTYGGTIGQAPSNLANAPTTAMSFAVALAASYLAVDRTLSEGRR